MEDTKLRDFKSSLPALFFTVFIIKLFENIKYGKIEIPINGQESYKLLDKWIMILTNIAF